MIALRFLANRIRFPLYLDNSSIEDFQLFLTFFCLNNFLEVKCMFGTNSICYQRPKAGYKT